MTGIEYFIAANPILTYVIIFLGMFIEGEAVVLLASIFVWQGYLSWPGLAIATVTGVIIGDIIWYLAARYSRDTWLGKRLSPKYQGKTAWLGDKIIAKYAWYATISKFIYFTPRIVISLAGWQKMAFKKFVFITTYTTLIWSAVILIVSYFFAYAIDTIGYKAIARRFELFAIGMFILVFLIGKLVKKIVVKKMSSQSP